MTNASAAVRRCHRVLLTSFAVAVSLLAGAHAAERALAVTELKVEAPRAMLYWASMAYAERAAALTAPKAEPARTAVADASAAATVAESERRCLAEAVYYESRGDTPEGQRAVAEVILRRTQTRPFPTTICGVVNQKVGRTCQFSYSCNIKRAKIYMPEFKQAQEAADYELTGPGRNEDLTGSATFFHAARISTNWKARYVLTRRVGAHVFYRMTDKSMRAYKNKPVPSS